MITHGTCPVDKTPLVPDNEAKGYPLICPKCHREYYQMEEVQNRHHKLQHDDLEPVGSDSGGDGNPLLICQDPKEDRTKIPKSYSGVDEDKNYLYKKFGTHVRITSRLENRS
jgi:hypothetical protein